MLRYKERRTKLRMLFDDTIMRRDSSMQKYRDNNRFRHTNEKFLRYQISSFKMMGTDFYWLYSI